MTFLPIVERELRAAARRKSTYRIRAWTAVLAMGVGFFSLMFLWLTRGRGSLGNPLFTNLTGYAFGLCLMAGVLLTADCLSEEKREGTLGLLFLTDLHGYDVVLGKFAAMLVSALYGLLALLPITAFPLLLGGVTAGEFWRTSLALVNMLFVSLAGGIWISALARDAQRAMGGALGLVLFLVAGLPALAGLASHSRVAQPFLLLSWMSPFFPFSCASASLYSSHAGKFWGTLIASQVLGWVFVALASRALPHQWQEGTVESRPSSFLDGLLRRGRGQRVNPEKARQELLPINPILWLASSEPAFRRLVWMIVLIWSAVVVLITALSPRELGTGMPNWSWARPFSFLGAFGFLLKALFVFQVCRFFTEARRNGALEMLLCTPLTDREIIRGQSIAARRAFLWPVLTFTGMLFVPVATRVVSGLSSLDLNQILTGGFGFAMSATTAVRTGADFLALFWLGLWLALTMKKPNLAPALTILLVLILPSVLCIFDIFADLFFILWGATKLQQDLRWVLAQQSSRMTSPIVTTASIQAPPIIARP